MQKRAWTMVVVLGTTLGACGPETTADEPLQLVPEGKADNYYSNRAREYKVYATIPVSITAEDLANETVRNEIVTRRLTAVALYLTGYVSDKFRGVDIDDDGEVTDDEVFFKNDGYGGFHAMVRNYSVKVESIDGGEGGLVVDLSLDMAGPQDLLSKIPRADTPNQDDFFFEFEMPEGATVDPADVPSHAVIRRFDPAEHKGPLETVRCRVEPRASPENAYPQYGAFAADGVLDITLFYGHDYKVNRSDLKEAEEAYDALVGAGYRSPVESFEDLAADSGPLVYKGRAAGRALRFEARIFHSDMFETDRAGQRDLAMSELVSRDIFLYGGHAGPYYGFYFDEHGEAKVKYHDIAKADFRSKQQLFIAQACQTYSQYADTIYAHEAKSEDNLDVITTVNFSYGKGTIPMLAGLLRTDRRGNHQPADFGRIIGMVNADPNNTQGNVFYGVIGMGGNPQLHPYASSQNIGRPCRNAADCGDPHGNVCLPRNAGYRNAGYACAAVSLSAAACPGGTRFKDYARNYRYLGSACVSAY